MAAVIDAGSISPLPTPAAVSQAAGGANCQKGAVVNIADTLGGEGKLCNHDYMTTTEGAEEKLRGWFSGRLPEGWFEGPPRVVLDREEMSVIGRLAEPDLAEGASEVERSE